MVTDQLCHRETAEATGPTPDQVLEALVSSNWFPHVPTTWDLPTDDCRLSVLAPAFHEGQSPAWRSKV